jgi:hypothetical protein
MDSETLTLHEAADEPGLSYKTLEDDAGRRGKNRTRPAATARTGGSRRLRVVGDR